MAPEYKGSTLFNATAELVQLSPAALLVSLLAVFAAGMIRGFAGFGLSAVMMASVVTIVPPVVLVPVCFSLEAIASFVMFRGGMRDADMRIVWGLVIGSALGMPLGLYAINTLDAELCKSVALALVLFLCVSQLSNVRPAFLATRPGLFGSGITAGIATGLASVGGMVVALYVLASDVEAKRMRASLVMYLFLGMFSSFFYLLAYGMFSALMLWRAMVLAPVMLLGLFIGTQMFKPSLQYLYKRVCLLFLILLCLVGLARQMM